MIAQLDKYKGWDVLAEMKPNRNDKPRWYAEKDGETVTLEAGNLESLYKLIDIREGG